MTVLTSYPSGQMDKALYHAVDTRYNLKELPPNLDPSLRARIEQQAQSIACLVARTLLIETTSKGSAQFIISPRVPTLAHKLKTGYEEAYKANRTEQKKPYRETEAKANYQGPFQDELSLGDGTAFLVGKQLVLTTAHCICDKISGLVSKVKLTSLRVLFGFQMQSTGRTRTEFAPKDVYHIDAVWKYSLKSNEADWALLKLDREVEGRDPLSLASTQMVSLKTSLYMLGHPSGLPLKLTMSGWVQKTSNPHFFETDLDAFAGNSGSPIFENDTGNMIGMLLKGHEDYANSTKDGEVIIHPHPVSKQDIADKGYEKCHKIASIGLVKTVLSSSFKMAHSHFSGRTKHLATLKAHLAPPPLFNPSQSTRVQILYGPSGVGKSELAIAFANQSIENFSFIWSISCGTDEERLIGYNGLARRLEIPLDEEETLSSLISKVHRSLEQNRPKPWLLLLDNFQTSPEPPNFPPLPAKGGSILITSYKGLNIQSLPKGATIVTEVLPLEPEEALKFLVTVTEKPSDDCKKLLSHVGCYPLVLGQVASYIKHTGIEVDEYLADLKRRRLSDSTPPPSPLPPQENPNEKTPKMPIERVVKLTLQKLLPPAAKQWLFLCSQLDAELIPISYLKAWLNSQSLAEEQAAIIIDVLEQHALLRYNEQEEVFSLHLELQRILRSEAPANTTAQVAHLLVNMRNGWGFENTSNWGETMKKATIWASHAEPVIKATGWVPLNGLKRATLLLERASLLDGLGEWENASARYEKALTYYSEALKIRRATLGTSHPDVASSLNAIGRCYHAQRNYNEALKAHGEALEIYRAALGEDHPSVAKSLNGIGICYNSQGNYNEGLKVHREALKIRRTSFGDNHPDVALSLGNIGNCYKSQGKYNEALKLYGEVLRIYRVAFEENHPHAASSLTGIGDCYFLQENYNEALKVYGEALKIRKTAFGENHPAVALSLGCIGSCYKSQEKYSEALKVYGEALKIRKATLKENHPHVAVSLNKIGSCYYAQGNYAEALNVYGEALRIYRVALEENNPNVARSLNNIGNCYCLQENYSEALKVYGEALKIRRAALGKNHPDVAINLDKIGNCYFFQGNYNEALKVYDEALKIRRAALVGNHSDVAKTDVARSLSNIGDCYDAQGNYKEALKVYDEALKIRRVALEENHPDVAMSLGKIGNCYYAQRNYNEALKVYREALKIKRTALGENHLDVAESLRNIGICYGFQGNYVEALKMHGEALQIRKLALGENHHYVAMSLNNMGICYRHQGNYVEALKVHNEALKIKRTALGRNHPSVAASLNNIGTCYDSQRNYTEALKVHGEALKIRKTALGENHLDVAMSLNNIGDCYQSQGKYNEALKVHREALKIYRAALRENHPSVAKTLRNITLCQARLKPPQ